MDDFAARIKEAVPIQDVVGDHVRLEAAGNVFRGLCPFHDDHKPSLIVDPRFQTYRCWACGAKGDAFQFLQDLERITFAEAKEKLAERAGIKLPKRGSGRAESAQLVYRVLGWAREEFQKELMDPRSGAAARAYLEERGLSSATVAQHHLGFAPLSYDWLLRKGRAAGFDAGLLVRCGLAKVGERGSAYDVFRGRLIFPIADERGRVLGFGARMLPGIGEGDGPKYLNTPATEVYNKSEVLYGIDVAAAELAKNRIGGATRSGPRTIVVMEGYTDCLMAWQHGFRLAVATCGTALTARHIGRLRSYADRVVLMFDGDAAGQKAAREATKLFLSAEMDLRLTQLPDSQDPCDFVRARGAAALIETVENARDALDFQIDAAKAQAQDAGIEGRRRALDDVLASLAEVPTLARQWQRVKFDLAVSRLRGAFGTDERTIRERILELRRRGSRAVPVPEAESPPVKMNAREREIVQWLAVHVSRADELLRVLPPGRLSHPLLRRVAEGAQNAYQQWGAEATSEAIREHLAEPEAHALLLELLESAPPLEEQDEWLENIVSGLAAADWKAVVDGSRRLADSVDVDEHLKELRRAFGQSAL